MHDVSLILNSIKPRHVQTCIISIVTNKVSSIILFASLKAGYLLMLALSCSNVNGAADEAALNFTWSAWKSQRHISNGMAKFRVDYNEEPGD